MVQKDSFKYILLNPAGAFEEIVREARAVLLLGGTMKPLSEFRSLLFPQVTQIYYVVFRLNSLHRLALARSRPSSAATSCPRRRCCASRSTRARQMFRCSLCWTAAVTHA